MSPDSLQPLDAFKPRELEVLRLIAEGRTNEEIAAQLFIEVTTVRWHNRQIYSKLGVHHRTLAVARARELGLLDLDIAEASRRLETSAATRTHNLPAQTTSFVGREAEIARVRELLAVSRLLTLTGPGGSGKTRLALQIAEQVKAEYADGVWFVQLASVHDPMMIAGVIAGVLNVAETPAETLDTSLVNFLSDKHMLLVIDNFEHMMKAAPLLSMLLAGGARIKLMVTTREVLRLYGEQEYPVLPLTIPDSYIRYTAQDLTSFEAVRLFVERAQVTQPSFELTTINAEAVAGICQRVDGLPLAVEMAAARIKLLSPHQLLTRLEHGFDSLGHKLRDAPARQQTLYATIDWSYNLLNADEKTLVDRLSIFRGGWTLEAMEAVCGGDLQIDCLDGLGSLIDKSLVQPTGDTNDQPRFKMLETVREYALGHLKQSGSTLIQSRHRDWFSHFAEQGDQEMQSPASHIGFERLRPDEDNLYAALDWCQEQPEEVEAGLRLAGALARYWHMRGTFREGSARITWFLEHAEADRTWERVRALNGAGRLAYLQGDYRAVVRLCSEALDISEALGDRKAAAFALRFLAHSWQEQGSYAEAEAMLRRSMALYQQDNDIMGISVALNSLGDLYRQYERYAEAEAMFDQALALKRDLKNIDGIATGLLNLGYVLCRRAETVRAQACFREGLEIAQEMNNQQLIVMCLTGFAWVSALKGELERLALLLGSVDHLLSVIGYTLEPPDHADFQWLLAQAREQLSEDVFQAAWDKGHHLTLEAAVAYAVGTNG